MKTGVFPERRGLYRVAHNLRHTAWPVIKACLQSGFAPYTVWFITIAYAGRTLPEALWLAKEMPELKKHQAEVFARFAARFKEDET